MTIPNIPAIVVRTPSGSSATPMIDANDVTVLEKKTWDYWNVGSVGELAKEITELVSKSASSAPSALPVSTGASGERTVMIVSSSFLAVP